MPTIKSITAREILNTKGDPTVETTIVLDNDIQATVSVPSGTSVSSYEAVDLKDADMSRFEGNGVLKAVHNVTDVIAPALIGKDPISQSDIDRTMNSLDGTPNKATLGANAILSVSLGVAKVAALAEGIPLYAYIGKFVSHTNFFIPTPLFNLINGGLHAVGSLDFQEFIIIPQTKKYSESLQITYKVRKTLEKMLLLNNLSTLIGDEGGFSPQFAGNTHAFQFLKEAIEEAGYKIGADVQLGIDAAATSFHHNNTYSLLEKKTSDTSDDLLQYYQQLVEAFGLYYLEDPFAEDDWEGWKKAMPVLSKECLVVGDDLVSTNIARHQIAMDQQVMNGVIIKPNQVGTLTEALDVVKKSKESGLKVIVSHRSGETNDDFIADFAVGIGADYCKFGAPVRGERVAKYNRLLHIEKEI